MSITRRDFVYFLGTSAALGVVGGTTKAFAGDPYLLRPPGAQDEQTLLKNCIKCDRCRSVCHTNCITYSKLEDGILQLRTPKINFHLGLCDFCNLCVEVCPTGAIQPFNKEDVEIGVAVVVPESCIAFKRPGSCQECYKACEYDAIKMVKGLPQVIEDPCNGCGACEYVCPSLVYGSVRNRSIRGIVVKNRAFLQDNKDRIKDLEFIEGMH